MRIEIERTPAPPPPVSGVVIRLSRDEAQALYEVANFSKPVSELVADSLGSPNEYSIKEVLQGIFNELCTNGFLCRRGA